MCPRIKQNHVVFCREKPHAPGPFSGIQVSKKPGQGCFCLKYPFGSTSRPDRVRDQAIASVISWESRHIRGEGRIRRLYPGILRTYPYVSQARCRVRERACRGWITPLRTCPSVQGKSLGPVPTQHCPRHRPPGGIDSPPQAPSIDRGHLHHRRQGPDACRSRERGGRGGQRGPGPPPGLSSGWRTREMSLSSFSR